MLYLPTRKTLRRNTVPVLGGRVGYGKKDSEPMNGTKTRSYRDLYWRGCVTWILSVDDGSNGEWFLWGTITYSSLTPRTCELSDISSVETEGVPNGPSWPIIVVLHTTLIVRHWSFTVLYIPWTYISRIGGRGPSVTRQDITYTRESSVGCVDSLCDMTTCRH